jgi:hypothetical protein
MFFIPVRLMMLGLFLNLLAAEYAASTDPASTIDPGDLLPPSAAFAPFTASSASTSTSTSILIMSTVTDEEISVPPKMPSAPVVQFPWPPKA